MARNRRARRVAATVPPPALAALVPVEAPPAGARRAILLGVFAASGFAGLIYESIWTHYLKLFLGHAAYAQTLVLAIFMGGMALGSWLAALLSGRFRNILLGYALSEAVVALFALVFHEIFLASTGWAHDVVLPHFAGFKWLLSAGLILPQCVLLGMTFPFMTAGVLRSWPDRPGRSLALLYFTNSLGAAVGVLVAGFALVRTLGLPGTVRLAGVINLMVAAVVWSVVRRVRAPQSTAAATEPARGDPALIFFLAVALLTGASSFIYEVAWIRMLSLVLGASTHSFELMLSAFILGLALGGLFIQRRIDRLRRPVRTLAWLQIAMGLFALGTLLLYGRAFEVMRWLVITLEKTDRGYLWFVLGGNGIAIAIMLPATFCAGTTLPLITWHLLQGGNGERSIGHVYAANTAGGIAAVFFAVHVGMPLLGLKGLLVSGAAIDIALGAALLWMAAAGLRGTHRPVAWTLAGAGAVAATLVFVQLDPYRMASGVYRTGGLLQEGRDEILFHEDGKTATVDVIRHPDSNDQVEILTNGKSDAAIAMKPLSAPSPDEPTMILLGALPMALHPQARNVACIGFGSGLTTHTLLGNPLLARVDTIEIEREMVHGAEKFRPRNERAFTDRRSHVVIDDAKTHFGTHPEKYDLIISEPSNPWVSGVAGLFSVEFYRLVGKHLAEGGIFGQWLQLYEIDVPLVVSVLKALEANFSDYVVYASTGFDLLIFARNGAAVGRIEPGVLMNPEIAQALVRIGVRSMQDLEMRRVGTRKSWEGLTRSFDVPMNSDYQPVLDQNAARTFFLRSDAGTLSAFQKTPFPALEMLSGVPRSRGVTTVTSATTFEPSGRGVEAMYLRDVLEEGIDANQMRAVKNDQLYIDAVAVSTWLRSCGTVPFVSLVHMLQSTLANVSVDEVEGIFRSLGANRCAASLSPLEWRWLSLLQAVGNRDAAAMRAGALDALSRPDELSPQAMHYAVAAGMLGSLALGDSPGAREIWAKAGGSIRADDELLLRVLVARAGAHP